MRGFQFFVSFSAPRCPPGLNSKYIADVPFDDHKARCNTTLYASAPAEKGVTQALSEEWKTKKTGLFRRDTHEFPHGLLIPHGSCRSAPLPNILRDTSIMVS
jgi:hypothetical protein